MNEEILRKYIKQGEGLKIELKSAQTEMPSNLFETVCAFLNRNGGIIILGVDKKGRIVGVNSNEADKIINNIVTTSNNPSKLDPPFILFPGKIRLKEGLVIYIQVPESSQVHKCNGKIYDRSDDGDFVLSTHQQISALYNRKSTYYTEGKIYQGIVFNDFNRQLFPKIRNLIASRSPSHPWLSLSDDEILKISGLWKKDYINNSEGYTLASVLLLGKDELIHNILPHYRIEILVRIKNLERYDDRLTISTNLIDAYERIMNYLLKSLYLPDKFHLEGDLRIDLRERIFREVVANLLIHREYTNAHIASIIIYQDRVEFTNANKPYYHGKIELNNFSPLPKNPIISKFFMQLGRVEEIGSGILNVQKYLRYYYPGSEPEFIDNDIFKAVIPIPASVKIITTEEEYETIEDLLEIIKRAGTVNGTVTGTVSGTVSDAVNEAVKDAVSDAVKTRLKDELVFMIFNDGISLKLLKEKFHIERRTALRDMAVLKNLGFVEFRGAPKTGRYVITDKIKKLKIKRI